MKSVGVKELKNKLSRYLHLVQEGETVFVTDRDDVIAEIHRPTTPSAQRLSPWECFLNDMERSGSFRRAKRHKTITDKEEKHISLDGEMILKEMRRDRF